MNDFLEKDKQQIYNVYGGYNRKKRTYPHIIQNQNLIRQTRRASGICLTSVFINYASTEGL